MMGEFLLRTLRVMSRRDFVFCAFEWFIVLASGWSVVCDKKRYKQTTLCYAVAMCICMNMRSLQMRKRHTSHEVERHYRLVEVFLRALYVGNVEVIGEKCC